MTAHCKSEVYAIVSGRLTRLLCDSMFSFAKFFELLVYSPAIHALSPTLCEHTAFPEKPWSPADTPIPQARFNIVRRFSYKGHIVTMTLNDIRDVFEVQVPRLQILRRKVGERKPPPDAASNRTGGQPSVLGDAHKILRREILRWWQGLSDHMDQLVSLSSVRQVVDGAHQHAGGEIHSRSSEHIPQVSSSAAFDG